MSEMRVCFVIDGPASGKERPRFTRAGHAFTPQKTRRNEGFIRHLASVAMTGRKPLEGPVKMIVAISVRPPESWSKKRKEAALAWKTYPTTKPDLDNIVKQIGDSCNGIVYLDDKQIVDLRCVRVFAEVDRTDVTILPMGTP